MAKIPIDKIRQVRRHCSAGVEACRRALEASGGDVLAALRALKALEELKRDEAWLLSRTLVPSNADGPPSEAERSFLAGQRAPRPRPDPEELRLAREGHAAFVATRLLQIAEAVRFTQDPDEAELALAVSAARSPSWVWLVARRFQGPAPSDHALVADALAREAGLSMIASSWIALPLAEAHAVARSLLATDLVYGDPCMSEPEADALSACLWAPLAPDAVYLSNRSAIAPTTFDGAIVAVDATHARLFCVGGED